MSRRARRAREGHSMSRLPSPPTVWNSGGLSSATVAAAAAAPPAPAPSAAPAPAPVKPIYIYPGLLRVMRQSAIALDARCPAAVYKCAQCEEEGVWGAAAGGPPPPRRCAHANACSICLEDFHGKDLVRRMPCNSNHVFHTRCILNWISSHDRCPLCNDVVSAHPVKQKVHICEDSSRSLRSLRRPPPPPSSSSSSSVSAPTSARPRSQLTPAQRAHAALARPTGRAPASTAAAATGATARPRVPPGINDTMSMRNLRRPDVVRNAREYQSGPLPRRKRGPRTYSYIVYDSVRMEVDQQQG